MNFRSFDDQKREFSLKNIIKIKQYMYAYLFYLNVLFIFLMKIYPNIMGII